jgi:serine/threonine-protein kinase
VLDQAPKARSQLRKASTVTLIVSQGPESIKVPQFIGLTTDEATALAKKNGITLDTSQRAAYPNTPSGVVATQDIPPGSSVDRGSTVHAIVSNGAGVSTSGTMSAVPGVVNNAYQSAIDAITKAGFTPVVKYSTQLDRNGMIVDQQPAPGTQAAANSTVTITLSTNGEVPDTDGQTVQDAQATLLSYGYRVTQIQYTTTEGADGKVVRTDPPAGTNLAPGSAVTLIVNGVAH